MSKSGALDLATGVGGKIKKEDVQSAVEQYNFFTPLMRMAWDVFVGSHASDSFLLPDPRHGVRVRGSSTIGSMGYGVVGSACWSMGCREGGLGAMTDGREHGLAECQQRQGAQEAIVE
ncbi:hypothetical protein C4D60_Mb04t03560 [Musa balbisiana]|uniref:Uncharacterized protein n=1 Tax=Musa balbisiana TaxID=52838 RepID=A0A4S8K9H1_MUSBA|nr:hypothetical protein C4D60_Mb04t03560 [Musa balbisiana]